MTFKWTSFVICLILIKFVSSLEKDDLPDFDFDNVDNLESRIDSDDYNYYYNEDDNALIHGLPTDLEDNSHLTEVEKKQQRIKSQLLNVWTNGQLKRKFAEVLPILKVMTSSQKLALAALISTQLSSEPGTELNLNQVREMFGDREELILPLTLDIANLVKMAGMKKDSEIHEDESPPKQQLLRRSFYNSDNIPSTSFLKDDKLNVEEGDSKIKRLNKRDLTEQIMNENNNNTEKIEGTQSPVIIEQTDEPKMDVNTQVENSEFITIPEPIEINYSSLLNESDIQSRSSRSIKKLNDRSYHERKLNMTAFNGTGDQLAMDSLDSVQSVQYALPETRMFHYNDEEKENDLIETYFKNNITLEEIEKLAFSDLNGTDLEEMDEMHGLMNSNDTDSPTAEKLISIRYKINRLPPPTIYRKRPVPNSVPDMSNCERFANVCIRTPEYPMEQIMGSIRRNRHAMTALLAEYRDPFMENNNVDTEVTYTNNRRGDNIHPTTQGTMCPSIIRYARPQKARSAAGEWKYIVNTGQHTQTLRLEKCSTPQESCTYLTDSFKSRCVQIFNYHRMLSWDKVRGLHVDIFKVPTCCSCHVDGYKETFPPFYSQKISDISPSFKHSIPKIKTNKFASNLFHDVSNDEDDDDDEEETDLASFYSPNKFNFYHSSKPLNIDTSYLLQSASSGKYRRFEKPKSTAKNDIPFIPSAPSIETYLSPPQSDFEEELIKYKRTPSTTQSSSKRKRRPSKRRDQSVSDSELKSHKLPLDLEITTIRPKKIYITPTPIIVDSKKREKVTVKLPNISSSSSDSSSTISKSSSSTKSKISSISTSSLPSNHLDTGKRINYNYHPIIDFFEEGDDDEIEERELDDHEIGDRIGLGVKVDRTSWRPMIHHRRRIIRKN